MTGLQAFTFVLMVGAVGLTAWLFIATGRALSLLAFLGALALLVRTLVWIF